MALFAESLERFESVELDGYEVEAPFARGGHSTVHRGRRLADDQPVAIKRWIDPTLRDGGLTRIKREINALRRLRCEAVVKILDARRDKLGQPCLIMEYVAGVSLAERLANVGPVKPETLLELLAPIFKALARFEELGLVHRDIKPANIVLRGPEGTPVVVDFSIAKWLDADDGESVTTAGALTATNAGIGTLPYMAPEQCAGSAEADLAVDSRTDLYGLGALVFHALTGTPPWQSESAWERMKRNPWVDPWPLDRERRRRVEETRESLSTALRAWCVRSLEGEPDERFPNVREMRQSLESAFGGPTRSVPPRHGPLALAGGLTLAALIGLAALSRAGAPDKVKPDKPRAAPRSSSPGRASEPNKAAKPSDTPPGPAERPGAPRESADSGPAPAIDSPKPAEDWQDRFCVSCGHRHGDDDSFCVRCGARRN